MGALERQLDDKGRLALPATFRDRLREHCYLAKGLDKCVTVVPSAVFEAEAEAMAARVRSGEVTRNQLRALASSAVLVELDKQGRVTLDENLRAYAEVAVGRPVVVAGSFDRLEIWSPDRFERVNDDGTLGLSGEGLSGEGLSGEPGA
ncbi:MAG: cell division/cell wall cluster transcriptional repressor MraZ [Actinobacteria bacterium]|nr:cell division/cell wall cluster transcriptional repressor MraZ [Actinomycetota bacterium]